MTSNENNTPDNLNIVFNILSMAFTRYLANKRSGTPNKELDLTSNVSINDIDLNN